MLSNFSGKTLSITSAFIRKYFPGTNALAYSVVASKTEQKKFQKIWRQEEIDEDGSGEIEFAEFCQVRNVSKLVRFKAPKNIFYV